MVLCSMIGCLVLGCGSRARRNLDSFMEKIKIESEIAEEVLNEEVESEITKRKEWNVEETESEDTETPEEKTRRLRSEEAVPPSISKEEVTNLRIEIHKKQHALQLWDESELIAEYALGLAKNPIGVKEKEGDNKNPEGIYYICNKNSKSQYHLALGLSYPNIEDANRGYEDGLISKKERDSLIQANENGKKPNWYTDLGGEIMIHGQKGDQGSQTDWTRGCFAVNNEVMDMIWDYVEVGTVVEIIPD